MGGFGDKDSIELGLWGTGSVISAAGLIMAIAFCGNLLSSTAVMNVVGLLLVTAVLLDTFIVRPIVTPALMVVLGSAGSQGKCHPLRGQAQGISWKASGRVPRRFCN